MQHNIALFSQNGESGYIPKPENWKEKAEEVLGGSGASSTQLIITVALLLFSCYCFHYCIVMLLLLFMLFVIFAAFVWPAFGEECVIPTHGGD